MEICFASALSSNFFSFMEVLTNLCNGFLQSLALRQKDDFDKDRDGRSNFKKKLAVSFSSSFPSRSTQAPANGGLGWNGQSGAIVYFAISCPQFKSQY